MDKLRSHQSNLTSRVIQAQKASAQRKVHSLQSPSFDQKLESFSIKAHAIYIYDNTIPGAEKTLSNWKGVFEGFCKMLGFPFVASETLIPLSETANPVLDLFQDLTLITDQAKSHSQPIFLFLVLNGHSYLYRNKSAIQKAQVIQGIPFYSRDGKQAQFTVMQYAGKDLIWPLDMQDILMTISRLGITRPIVVLDTCHSMSLVSTLLCPAGEIRILHSTTEDEQTLQNVVDGSLASHAWMIAINQELNLIQKFLSTRSLELYRILKTEFWELTRRVALNTSSQVLTTGPGQSNSIWIESDLNSVIETLMKKKE